ncbi:MAG: hypothetical protein ACW98Y_08005 [Candidatus Thorarchaeota archaeon]|jgi:hypothetical protein
MITEITLQEKPETKQEIVHLISNNVSAILLIAEHLHVNEEVVSSLIAELVEEGILKGTFSPDGLRFYRSDVKMPTLSEEPEEVVEKDNSMFIIPKSIVVIGIIMFVVGQIFARIFAEGTSLREMSGGLVLIGLLAIFGGLFSFTKFEEKYDKLQS